MTKLIWDRVGKKKYETGVSRGVFYPKDGPGVVWNGLISVTESPTGGENSSSYADNGKYLTLTSIEEFAATIEAYSAPEQFLNECDGRVTLFPGLSVGQQVRKPFGFSYTSLVGNDTQGVDHAKKIHLIYGALALPSEKSRTTVSDAPEAVVFSWEITASEQQELPNTKPFVNLTLDSSTVPKYVLDRVEDILYGTNNTDPRLPSASEIMTLFEPQVDAFTSTFEETF